MIVMGNSKQWLLHDLIKETNKFNQGIRSTILYKEDEITVGDLLMVVKNNYYWLEEDEKVDFIANGDIVEIKADSRI